MPPIGSSFLMSTDIAILIHSSISSMTICMSHYSIPDSIIMQSIPYTPMIAIQITPTTVQI